MFLSAMSSMGLATAYTLSQMGVIISTFGAIIFLGEKKTKKEFTFTFFGTAAVLIGGVLVGMIK
jgi:glucose uptake protein